MRMNNAMAKIVTKVIGGATVGMIGIFGMAPITAFAGGAEAECICEVKCTEDDVNPDCEVCSFDYTCCEGEEPEAEEHWGPLTPDGNMNLVDDYGSLEAGGKQFITVTSKNGNYFYIIIDRDDNGNETVHFLNLVDEADLLSLMDEEEVDAYLASKAEGDEPVETPVVEEPVTEEPEPVETVEPEKQPANVTGIMAVILVLAVGGIAGYMYFKSNKNKPNKPTGPDPDADYDDDDEEDYLDEVINKDDLDNEESEDDADGN